MPPSVHCMPKTCIKRQNICDLAVPRCVWSSGNWAVREK